MTAKTTIERVEFVVSHLRAAMPRLWPEIAKQTGVPEKTICKIAYRETKDPRTSTTEALHDYFAAQDRDRATQITSPPN